MYVAASAVYGLEAELGDLEECARAVGSATSELELAFLEEQVASAAARVHQSDLQVRSRSHLTFKGQSGMAFGAFPGFQHLCQDRRSEERGPERGRACRYDRDRDGAVPFHL